MKNIWLNAHTFYLNRGTRHCMMANDNDQYVIHITI